MKGNLSINSENILPVIKKWLYSDTDIFVRELVSNACDAITKLKKLVDLGQVEHISPEENYKINIELNKDEKTIKITDNGIGMTENEIQEYINQIAFSGATAFMEKYGDKLDKDNEIIGHFGLGFYSAFMVSDKVEIDTLSFVEGEKAVKWVSEGGTTFEITEGEKDTRGTSITLYINESSGEYLEEYKLRQTIEKYCGFMPVEIYFETLPKKETDKKDENEEIDEIEEEIKCLNDPHPLWLKPANECTDEEYKDFYHKVFMDFNEPLFWMHLNMDYPFRLKGILYFPKLKHELESIEGQVKLYNNQVFIADNIKEVIPEFLLLLKGVMDCPDLPLNVSRSFLQNDSNVAKMSSYIIKKVGDKLNSIFKNDRETYNKYWDDISPFIKYGCIREKSFYDKVKDSLIFKTTNNEYLSTSEFIEKNKDKTDNKIYYATNEQQQASYIKMFKDNAMEAVVLTSNLDNPFISYLENYDNNVQFLRIDSDVSDTLKNSTDEKISDDDKKYLDEIFKSALNNEKLNLQVESLKSENVPAIITLAEQSRRMQEMTKMFGNMGMGADMFKDDQKLILNQNNNLIKTLIGLKDNADKNDLVKIICEQIYDLAMISHKPLDVDSMNNFIERSNLILQKLSE